jgi:hypothetical protein
MFSASAVSAARTIVSAARLLLTLQRNGEATRGRINIGKIARLKLLRMSRDSFFVRDIFTGLE